MDVILYSNHCPQCRVLENELKKKRIQYTEVNDVDLMLSKGFLSMPVLEVNNETMNFASALKWVNNK